MHPCFAIIKSHWLWLILQYMCMFVWVCVWGSGQGVVCVCISGEGDYVCMCVCLQVLCTCLSVSVCIRVYMRIRVYIWPWLFVWPFSSPLLPLPSFIKKKLQVRFQVQPGTDGVVTCGKLTLVRCDCVHILGICLTHRGSFPKRFPCKSFVDERHLGITNFSDTSQQKTARLLNQLYNNHFNQRFYLMWE